MLSYNNDTLNNELLQIQIEELQHQISKIMEKNKKYKKNINILLEEQRKDNDLISSWGFNDIDDLNKFIQESKNHICIIDPDDAPQDLYDQVYDQCYNEIEEDIYKTLLDKYSFSEKKDLLYFINKYHNHKCTSRPVSYLTHNELMENNYYSQLINSCYIINKQLKNEKKKNIDLYKEVSYFRNLYMNDKEKREQNILLDLNLEIPEYDNSNILSYVNDMIKNHMDDHIIYDIIEKRKITHKCLDRTCIEFIPNKYTYCYNHYDIIMKKKKIFIDKGHSKVTLNKVFYNKYFDLAKINKLNNYIKQCSLCEVFIPNEHSYCYKHLIENQKKRKGLNKKAGDKSPEGKRQRKMYKKHNQNLEINNLLDNIIKKNRNTKTYKIRLETNRAMMKMFSELYKIKDDLDHNDLAEMESEGMDTNPTRLKKNMEIYNILYNNDVISNSDYIYNVSLFNPIKYKLPIIDLLVYKLELLCKGVDIEEIKNIDEIPKLDNNNNDIQNTQNIHMEDTNIPDNAEEDEIVWVDACGICCINIQSNNNDLRVCDECFNNMNKTCSSKFDKF